MGTPPRKVSRAGIRSGNVASAGLVLASITGVWNHGSRSIRRVDPPSLVRRRDCSNHRLRCPFRTGDRFAQRLPHSAPTESPDLLWRASSIPELGIAQAGYLNRSLRVARLAPSKGFGDGNPNAGTAAGVAGACVRRPGELGLYSITSPIFVMEAAPHGPARARWRNAARPSRETPLTTPGQIDGSRVGIGLIVTWSIFALVSQAKSPVNCRRIHPDCVEEACRLHPRV